MLREGKSPGLAPGVIGALASMKRVSVDTPSRESPMIMREQIVVNSYFQHAASYWTEIYRREGVLEFIHQERQRLMLGLVETLGLPYGTRVLEIGCGAGFAAVELAKKGYAVDAIDSVPVMVDLTRKHATRSAVAGTVKSTFGSIQHLVV